MVKRYIRKIGNNTTPKAKLIRFSRNFITFACFGIFKSHLTPEQDETTVETCIVFLIVLHLIISFVSLLLAVFVRNIDPTVIGFTYGLVKRFYKTVSIQLFSAILISLIVDLQVKYILIAQQSTLLLFPFFLFIYTADILKRDFVFSLYLAFVVEKIGNSISLKNRNIGIVKKTVLKLLIILSSIYSYFAFKSSIFIDV